MPRTQPVDYTAVYDADGLRVSSVLNGIQRVYSGGLNDEAGSTLYTPGVGQNKGGPDRYFSDDWLGSVRYLTDGLGASTTGYRYDAYGNISAQAGVDSTSVKFAGNTGYESDGPAGLLMLGQRYYDPPVGRFISPDPIGFAGGLNFYAYCDNDPINAVDPSGLDPTLGAAVDPDAPDASYDQLISNTHFMRRDGWRGAFHGRYMRRVNNVRTQAGFGRFESGNEPLGWC